jgi:BTB/POZ domain
VSIDDNLLPTMDASNELMGALKTYAFPRILFCFWLTCHSLLEVGKYSDLTIRCRDKSYAVHRAIICSRSGFFDGACSSSFTEAQTGIIDLSEDDAEAVEHMVHCRPTRAIHLALILTSRADFYNLDYLSHIRSHRSSMPTSPIRASSSSPFSSRVTPRKILNLAFVEDPLLATAAASYSMTAPRPPPTRISTSALRSSMSSPLASPFSEVFPSNKELFEPSAVEEPLDSDNWDLRSASSQEPHVESPHLLTHTRVYALAEKYGINGLKALAKSKFASQMSLHFASVEFAPSIQEVYESTVDSDRGLRDIVIQTFRSHPEVALREDVEDVVRNTPGLAWELFRVGWGLPIKP